MSKRRRKNLSGSASEHGTRQDVHLSRAKSEERQVYTALNKREDCGEAADHLLRAAASWGAYNAEKDWSGKVSEGENRHSNSYAATKDLFHERCVVGRRR